MKSKYGLPSISEWMVLNEFVISMVMEVQGKWSSLLLRVSFFDQLMLLGSIQPKPCLKSQQNATPGNQSLNGPASEGVPVEDTRWARGR